MNVLKEDTIALNTAPTLLGHMSAAAEMVTNLMRMDALAMV